MVSNQIVQPTDKSNNLALICISSKSDTHYLPPAALQNCKTENNGMTQEKMAVGRKLVPGHLPILVNVTEEPISILCVGNYYLWFFVTERVFKQIVSP